MFSYQCNDEQSQQLFLYHRFIFLVYYLGFECSFTFIHADGEKYTSTEIILRGEITIFVGSERPLQTRETDSEAQVDVESGRCRGHFAYREQC